MAITPQQIEEARTKSQQTAQSAIDFSSKSSQVQNELSEALKGNLSSSGIPEKRATALADYMAAPAESRQTYGSPESEAFIFNPWQRDALIQRNVAQARIPYSTLSDYFMMEAQSIPEIVGSYGNLYNDQANAMMQAAQLQRQGYGDLLSEYQMQQDEAYKQQQLALERAKLGGGGGGGSSLGSIFGALLSGETDPETLRKGLMASVLAGDMSATEANFILQQSGLETGTTAGRTDKAKQEAISKAERLVNEALSLIDKGGRSSGLDPWYTLTKGIAGDPNKNRTRLSTILSELAGPLAFGEAGKALTATELGLIGGKVPTILTNEARLKNQLNAVLENIYQTQPSGFQQIGRFNVTME